MGAVFDRGGAGDGARGEPGVTEAGVKAPADDRGGRDVASVGAVAGAPGGARDVAGSAWRSGRAWAVLLGAVVLGTAADLWSKWAAFGWIADAPVVIRRAEALSVRPLSRLLPEHDPVVAVPGVLEFTLVLNPGAVFGLGAGLRWVFVAFTLLALAFGGYLFAAWTTRRDTAAHAGIGLLLAGGLGNLYDRLVFGCVRDFIHPLPGLRLPFGLRWPSGSDEVWPYVSNVADLWLIIGIVALVWVSLSGGSGAARPAADDASDGRRGQPRPDGQAEPGWEGASGGGDGPGGLGAGV